MKLPVTASWTIGQWAQFHRDSTADGSSQLLSELWRSQSVAPRDPAWISLAS